MALYGILLEERAGSALFLLPFLLAFGFASVWYWHATDDLRPYLWVQFYPLVTLEMLFSICSPIYSEQRYLYYALGLYALAKIVEFTDKPIYRLTRHIVSGHTLKHLVACWAIHYLFVMLQKRRLLTST